MNHRLADAASYGSLLLLASLSGPAAALPAPPERTMLTSAEQALVAKGEVALRSGKQNSDGMTLAIIDLRATPAAVIDAVVDLMPRVAENSLIDRAAYYREERDPAGTGWLGIQWFVGGLGITKAFHVLYEYDRNQGYCVYSLDGSKPNEISAAQGSYYAYPSSGGSRLEYRASADAGGGSWLRSQVEGAALREQLLGIQARAQAK